MKWSNKRETLLIDNRMEITKKIIDNGNSELEKLMMAETLNLQNLISFHVNICIGVKRKAEVNLKLTEVNLFKIKKEP